MSAFVLSLFVVFVAELGDKSQLMTMTFASRYRVLPVLTGVAIGTALVHLVSVLVGAVLGAALPTGPISILAGLVFLGFALWTLRGEGGVDGVDGVDGEGSVEPEAAERAEEEKVAAAVRADRSIALAVGSAFFLAELGDKTQLATITLAADHGGLVALTGVWAGATVGMVTADVLALLVGLVLGRRLPEKVIKIGASLAFAVFGALLLVEGIRTVLG